jgi:regulation of enolase protein 1 (concanavalin A-like superfamily)
MRVAAAALFSLLALQEKVLFEDRFAGKLADGWNWVREDPSGWKLEGGSLKIKSQPGKIWYKTKTAKNVALRRLPENGTAESPIAIEVTVEGDLEANSEQSGLYLHFDDGNFVKIIREHLRGKTNILVVKEQKGIPDPQPVKEEPAPSVRLRLVWMGQKVRGAYKAGADWVQVGEVDCPVPDGSASVGLACHGGAADADRWGKFNDCRIVKLGK